MSNYFYITNNRALAEQLLKLTPSFLEHVYYEGQPCYKYSGPAGCYIQSLLTLYPFYEETIALASKDILLDLSLKTLQIKGEEVHITPEMFCILKYLMANNTIIVSLDRLSDVIASRLPFNKVDYVISDNSMRTVISKIRHIFRMRGLDYMPLKTAAKYGYYWNEHVDIVKKKRE